MIHYTHPYFLNPPHQITIDLVGLGGTGSQVLNNLGRLNHALRGLNHPGLHVRSWDDDMVTETNIGRQLFSPADLRLNKAVVLTSRVNRFFGTNWEAAPKKYNGKERSNILITCIDSAAGRISISETIKSKVSRSVQPTEELLYWLDIGNLQKTGQVCLGTVSPVPQPKGMTGTARSLPHVIKKFPSIKKVKEEAQGPSCSLAESLEKQDLFINSTLAQFGCNLIWKLLREGNISYQGCYVNLETLSVNPIRIN